MGNFSWPQEAIEMLARLAKDGRTGEEAAFELNKKFQAGLSRSSVIGKAARLGVNFKGVARHPRSTKMTHAAREAEAVARERRAVAPPAQQIAPALAPVADIAIPVSRRVTLFDLRDGMCRWPIGEPAAPEFRFCGTRSVGAVYCGDHTRIAYTTPAEQKRAAAEWREKHRKAARAA
jgi:GcrA cell cycle regulator